VVILTTTVHKIVTTLKRAETVDERFTVIMKAVYRVGMRQ
jgi:hypothetical protein